MNHHHDWTRVETGYQCTECVETCTACTSPRHGEPCDAPTGTSHAICDRCLDDARHLPHDIAHAYAQIPDVIAAISGLHGVRYDRSGPKTARDDGTLPFGGDALAMTVVGNPSDAGRNTWDELTLRDPEPVVTFLTRWEDEWRQTQGLPAAETTSLETTIAWLDRYTLWAANTLDPELWGAYLAESRAMRARLWKTIGRDRSPVREPVPCVYCGGTIIREWHEDGLSDTHRCTGQCARTWPNPQAMRFTNRHTLLELPETYPDTLVTLDEVRRIFPEVKRNTINQWISRDRQRHAEWVTYQQDLAARQADPDSPEPDPVEPYERTIPERGTNERGDTLYRLGDLHQWRQRPAA